MLICFNKSTFKKGAINGYKEKEKNSKKEITRLKVSLHKTSENFRGFMFIVMRPSDSIKK